MLFNSIDFAIYLPIGFFFYWKIFNKNIKTQNFFILCLSYLFYGMWNWKFLFLIAFSSVVDYYLAILIDQSLNSKKRKLLLVTSLFVNIGFLAYFKYYNFFLESFIYTFSFFGKRMSYDRLDIVLPVGISFYTFQTLSYTIDVYLKKIKPQKDIIAFASFVSFFPQLVAGPIERASNLLPQFLCKRKFNYDNAIIGINQIIWGLFKKIVIADTCAQYVNFIFDNYSNLNGMTLIIGVIAFSFQIYGDFSGYSDIAIGVARLFDFKLMKNFKYPYFSSSISEFWRNWHISLSTWFKDYIYIPLGGNKVSDLLKIRNIFIVFIVSGFWHGPNWTFIFWGMINAFFIIPDLLKKQIKTIFFLTAFGVFKTYIIICFGWIFFRANNLNDAFNYIYQIFNSSYHIERLGIERLSLEILPLIFGFSIIEFIYRKREFPLYNTKTTIFTYIIILMIIVLGSYSDLNDFIYFQF